MARVIELKTVSMGENRVSFEYYEQVLGLLKTPADPKSGMSADEMIQVMPLINKIQEAGLGKQIILEEEEWRLLCDRVNNSARYNFADQVIVDFIKHVRDAQPAKLQVADA